MIIQCKICKGVGKITEDLMVFGPAVACSACKGAGEFKLQDDMSDYIKCKVCDGNGITEDTIGQSQICSACKGIGLIIRPVIGKKDRKIGKRRELDIDDKSYPLKNQTFTYVSKDRITDLKKINGSYDFTRLIKYCEEMNMVFENKCYFSVAMLVRAIIDHVPPILNCTNFTEVVNNYKGTRSFKESMRHLELSSRKIADSFLHTQIRKSEILPTQTQVDFSNDLDVLLAEIIRIMKNP